MDVGDGETEAGGGRAGIEDGAGMETLDQVIPLRMKRVTVREVPL